jgi:hypothetical protein
MLLIGPIPVKAVIFVFPVFVSVEIRSSTDNVVRMLTFVNRIASMSENVWNCEFLASYTEISLCIDFLSRSGSVSLCPLVIIRTLAVVVQNMLSEMHPDVSATYRVGYRNVISALML